jgi:hypothetical protein
MRGHKDLRTKTSIRSFVPRKSAHKAVRRPKGPSEEERLLQELVALRKEVKELRGVVNLLMEMVMEHGDAEEFEADYGDFRMDKNSRLPLGM